MEKIVRAGGIQGLDYLVEKAGFSFDQAQNYCHLADVDLNCVDEYLPYANVLQLIQYASDTYKIHDIGLRLADYQGLDFIGLLGIAIKGAGTIHDAFVIAARYIQFHTPAVNLVIGTDHDENVEKICLQIQIETFGKLPQPIEHALLHLCNIVRGLSHDLIRPLEIHIPHKPISELAVYQHYFGCNVKFNQKESAIFLDAQLAKQPLPHNNHALLDIAERELQRHIKSKERSFDLNLTAVLKQLLPTGKHTIEDTAHALKMHPRTLQRRLKKHATTFQEIRNNARKELLLELLKSTSLSLADISLELGFSEQSVMTKHCKDWYGLTPSALRKPNKI
jgi:AraC-like DNA-binding protein